MVATEEPAGRDDDIDGFPLMWVDVVAGAAGTVPKDFTTLSFMGFGAAGDDDIGADASSIEPKVTDEPGEGVSGEAEGVGMVHTLFRGCGAYVIAGDADAIFDRDGLTESTWAARVGEMGLGLSGWGGRLGAGGWR